MGIGTLAGYNYCTEESGDDTLRDCVIDSAVNVHHTLWGDPEEYPPGTYATGTLATVTFNSEALNQAMQYAIYLPPGYDDPNYSSVRYPVVYLLPGSGGDTTQWVYAGLAQRMDELLAQGQVQPMILVVPQESPEDTFGVGHVDSNGGYIDGPLGKWATYTTRDLVNEIDSNYRTVVSKESRAIAGLSEGGYGAMNLGLKNRSEFGVIGSFSGYFTIDEDDLSRLFGGDQNLAEVNSPLLYLPQLEGELPVIYFYVGQNGGKRNLLENQEFAEELKAYGASYEFNIFPGRHNWDLWKAHLPDFLIFASEHLKSSE